jgi:HAD superfamily hydrolase (TIGR01509 family)
MDVKHGKPSPEIYMKTMDILNVEPQETLIFEDSDIGIQAAKASGASVMKITADAFSD